MFFVLTIVMFGVFYNGGHLGYIPDRFDKISKLLLIFKMN